MSRIMVTPCYGEPFEVDTSDKACEKFGFKHGDRIRCPGVGVGTVIGVARSGEGPDVLWYAIDGRGGNVSYSYPSKIEAE